MKNKFSIGDRVKVVKKVTAPSKDFCNSWVTPMDESIGKTYTVEFVGKGGISFKEIRWSFPPSSLVKVGFSNFDEVIKYMKCGGYVLAELLENDFVYYRIKKGILEVNDFFINYEWVKSFYDITEIQRGRVTDIHRFTKRKYS